MSRIANRYYEPTDDDVIRARLRTIGVQEYRIPFQRTSEYHAFLACGVLFGSHAPGQTPWVLNGGYMMLVGLERWCAVVTSHLPERHGTAHLLLPTACRVAAIFRRCQRASVPGADFLLRRETRRRPACEPAQGLGRPLEVDRCVEAAYQVHDHPCVSPTLHLAQIVDISGSLPQ